MRILGLAVLITGAVYAQTTPSPWTRWGTDIHLLLDGYADWNFNSPPTGLNALRNFDTRADAMHLSMAMLTLDRAPAPIGFHLDAGFGQTFDLIHKFDTAPGELKYFNQAYLSLKPKAWHGLEVDAGEFASSAGAEVVATDQNWNYSRSLLFVYAVPYYHFGVRTSMPLGHNFTAGLQIVNGWNDVRDNNSGKTLGINGGWTGKRVTWAGVYYAGPEKDRDNQGWRQLYDTTVVVRPTAAFSYYVNFDYGRDKNIGPGARQWMGVAAAGRWEITKRYALAARAEWFEDRDGLTTGAPQILHEATLTGEYRFRGWLLGRLEFRDDRSNQPFFERGARHTTSQPTALLALVAVFGSAK